MTEKFREQYINGAEDVQAVRVREYTNGNMAIYQYNKFRHRHGRTIVLTPKMIDELREFLR